MLPVRKFTEKKKMNSSCIAKAIFTDHRIDDIFDINPPVKQLARNRDLFLIFVDIVSPDVCDVSQPDTDPCTVLVSQADFYIVFVIAGFVDIVVFVKKRRDLGYEIVFEKTRVI